MTTFLIALAITVPLSIIVGYFSRREPIRNGYQARVRTRLKGGKVAIIEPEDDARIVGDGPYSITPAQYPRSERVRDMPEPRGL